MRGYRIIVFCFLSIVLCPLTFAKVNADSIYNGTQIKLDIASPILVPAVTKWQIQNYEMAVNVRLAKRYYPTFELGYAGGTTTQGDTLNYRGHGGFFRVGADINPLKKHPESPHAMLIGVRLGTSVQQIHQNNTQIAGLAVNKVAADCWGEIVAGCQVEIAKVNNTSFYMGWMGRFKCLFTRSAPTDSAEELQAAIYIPGFGRRDNIGWGASYYLGWRF